MFLPFLTKNLFFCWVVELRISFFGILSGEGSMFARYFLVLFCFMGFSSEREPLLLSDPGAEVCLQAKLQDALTDETSLWLMIVHKGKRYTVSYDVHDEINRWVWTINGKRFVPMILPVVEYLQVCSLKGCVRKPFCEEQKVLCVKLPVTDRFVGVENFKNVSFTQGCIQRFLMYSCPKLHEKNCAQSDGFGCAMTQKVLQSIQPSRGKYLRLLLETPEQAVERIVSAKIRDTARFFMPIPGVGVLTGCAEAPGSWQKSVPEKNLLEERKVALVDQMCQLYPFCPERWKLCLNYEIGVKVDRAEGLC